MMRKMMRNEWHAAGCNVLVGGPAHVLCIVPLSTAWPKRLLCWLSSLVRAWYKHGTDETKWRARDEYLGSQTPRMFLAALSSSVTDNAKLPKCQAESLEREPRQDVPIKRCGEDKSTPILHSFFLGGGKLPIHGLFPLIYIHVCSAATVCHEG